MNYRCVYALFFILLIPFAYADYCEDSDGGIDLTTKGNLVFDPESGAKSFYDSCYSSLGRGSYPSSCEGNSCYVLEYSCSGDTYTSEKYPCSQGCNDGVCLGEEEVEEETNDCSDGTPGSSCADKKPYFCNNGELEMNCLVCGCPSGTLCDGEICKVFSDGCSDGIKNNYEIDVDCGGGICPACDVGQMCEIHEDCASNWCDTDFRTCLESKEAQCFNGKLNRGEIDVDCAENCEQLCAVGKVCAIDEHCESSLCVDGKCADPEAPPSPKPAEAGEATRENTHVEAPTNPVESCRGCMHDESCLPIGVRVGDTFCGSDKRMHDQYTDQACTNNFECSTNLCHDAQCVESGQFNQFLRWLAGWVEAEETESIQEDESIKEEPSFWEKLFGSNEPEEQQEEESCTETDDRIDYDTMGFVEATYRENGELKRDSTVDRCITKSSADSDEVTIVDSCEWNENCFVQEAYCNKRETPWSIDTSHQCPYGCKNGACLERKMTKKFCEDTDGGYDRFTYGETRGHTHPELMGTTSPFFFTDQCYDSTGDVDSCSGSGCGVREYKCDDDGSYEIDAYERYNTYFVWEQGCRIGCNNGACLPEEDDVLCQDSDKGINFAVAGAVTIIDSPGEAADQCWLRDEANGSSRSVSSCSADEDCWIDEVYCSEGRRQHEMGRCEHGCKEGACLDP